MINKIARIVILLTVFMLLAACGGGTQTATPEPPAPGPRQVEAESNRDGVFTIENGQREQLPAPNQAQLNQGDGVDVDESGRAILRFQDLLTVEVLRDGELTLQQLDLEEQSAFVTVAQRGGALINNFSAEQLIDKRFTVQTEFATIEATGTQFMIVKEANSPLEWVVGMDAGENDLTVTADGVTKPVTTGMARWIAPIGEPSAGIDANMTNVDEWITGVRAGQQMQEIGDMVWAQADVVATPDPLATLPAPGEQFELQGVQLTLDPEGLFGTPTYALEDCNNDGQNDIAMRSGRLEMDFRGVLSRVRAVDVTVLNLAGENSGSLRVLNPAREQIGVDSLEASAGNIEVLSARSDQPYHYAELAVSDGCFLGFSLTPPKDDGTPGDPRPVATVDEEEEQVEAPVCTVVYPGSDGLNFRSGPGTEYTPPIGTLYQDTRLTPLGRNQAGTWLYVEVQESGQQGWVSASEQFVNCTIDTSTLPIEAGPPITPTPESSVRITSPAKDSPAAVTDGFVLRGDATVPDNGSLVIWAETADGVQIQEKKIVDVNYGTVTPFELETVIDYPLPADIRIRAQVLDAAGNVRAEDSVLMSPLFPGDQVQRPDENGIISAIPVGSNGYDFPLDLDGDPGEWIDLLENSDNTWTPIANVVPDLTCPQADSSRSARYENLRGQVAFAYDSEALYVAFAVQDNVFESYDGSGYDYYLGDSPQLLLDADLAGDYATSALNDDDLQIDFHPGTLIDSSDSGAPYLQEPRLALWQLDSLQARNFSEAGIASGYFQSAYFVEAALPWQAFGIAPAAGDRIGIAASVSDDDTPGTDRQECMLSTAPQRNWQDPTTWGTLILGTRLFRLPDNLRIQPPTEFEPVVPLLRTPVP